MYENTTSAIPAMSLLSLSYPMVDGNDNAVYAYPLKLGKTDNFLYAAKY